VIPGRLGAVRASGGDWDFLVWAPRARTLSVHFPSDGRTVAIEPAGDGHFAGRVEAERSERYRFRIDGRLDRADPASRWQPEGVFGPSALFDPAFPWSDAGWRGVPRCGDAVLEIHVGTFTAEGTFDGVAARLSEIVQLGVGTIELMPVSQFPGERNWGYDGVFPFACQHSYGGPRGLQRLVDAAHAAGLSVLLDFVANHFGPEGCVLADYGPAYAASPTPWGPAPDFDGPAGASVRRFFLESAVAWVRDFHLDGLRLDAAFAIPDSGPRPFLDELADAVSEQGRQSGRTVALVAETDGANPRLVRPRSGGGLGLDSEWDDGLHHALHASLTGETTGVYAGFGSLDRVVRELCRVDPPPRRRVVFAQNHDQVGNRAAGERLTELAGFDRARVAAAAVILSPMIPLLFMGEEWGCGAPFLFFTDFRDGKRIEAVREGRRRDLAALGSREEPPDPESLDTFLRSKLDGGKARLGRQRKMREFYRDLLRIRLEIPSSGFESCRVFGSSVVAVRDPDSAGTESLLILQIGEPAGAVPLRAGNWTKVLDSAETRWGGPGSAVETRIAARGPGAAIRPVPDSALLFVRDVELD